MHTVYVPVTPLTWQNEWLLPYVLWRSSSHSETTLGGTAQDPAHRSLSRIKSPKRRGIGEQLGSMLYCSCLGLSRISVRNLC